MGPASFGNLNGQRFKGGLRLRAGGLQRKAHPAFHSGEFPEFSDFQHLCH